MSGFGKHDKEEHNREIEKASDYLLESLIPAFVRNLTEKYKDKAQKINMEKVGIFEEISMIIRRDFVFVSNYHFGEKLCKNRS
jgi:hypothetical protein